MTDRFNCRIIIFIFSIFFIFQNIAADACSRLLWNTNNKAVVSARTMDWAHQFDDYLFIYPRGIKMDGGTDKNPVKWTSKYGSLGNSVYGYAQKHGFGIHDTVTDGINEKGLTVHLLYLEGTQYEAPDDRPTLSYMRWCRYLLDNFATVKEAVAGIQKVRVVAVPFGGEKLGLHVAMEDPSGDSAIIEYINGNEVIHHGKQYTVMTNDPAYNVQLENIKRYKGFGGDEALPGTVEGDDRFVRLTHYVKHLPEPKDADEAAGFVLSAINTVVVPFGAPYTGRSGDAGVYPTWWTSVTDVTNRVYYFNWAMNPNIIWVELDRLDFNKGTPVKWLNPRKQALAGDVSNSFEPVPK